MLNLTVRTGRPSFPANARDRKQVKALAGMGFRHEDIAMLLGIAPKTLRKHFRSELDCGAIEANAKVVKALFDMATSGENTAASIFWTKTRCGWREGAKAREASEDELPALVVRRQ